MSLEGWIWPLLFLSCVCAADVQILRVSALRGIRQLKATRSASSVSLKQICANDMLEDCIPTSSEVKVEAERSCEAKDGLGGP